MLGALVEHRVNCGGHPSGTCQQHDKDCGLPFVSASVLKQRVNHFKRRLKIGSPHLKADQHQRNHQELQDVRHILTHVAEHIQNDLRD